MNQYKKLILSMTMTLLSSAGVMSMGPNLPKITTLRDFGAFLEKYSKPDFLANKNSLLEYLLNSYNDLPAGVRAQAQQRVKVKLGTDISQLSNLLQSLDKSKIIPVTLQQAQSFIRSISTEKQQLTRKTASLEKQISSLNKLIAGHRSGTPVDGILEVFASAEEAIPDLQALLDELESDKAALTEEIQRLQTAGANSVQLAGLQKNLADANTAIADSKAKIAQYETDITKLKAEIDRLINKLPDEKIKVLLDEYKNLSQDATLTGQLPADFDIAGQKVVWGDESAINKINDLPALETAKIKFSTNIPLIKKELDEQVKDILDSLDIKWKNVENAADKTQLNEQGIAKAKIDAAIVARENFIKLAQKTLTAIQARIQELKENAGLQGFIDKITELQEQITVTLDKHDNEKIKLDGKQIAFKQVSDNDIKNTSDAKELETAESNIINIEHETEQLIADVRAEFLNIMDQYSQLKTKPTGSNLNKITNLFNVIKGFVDTDLPDKLKSVRELKKTISVKIEELQRVGEETALSNEINTFITALPKLTDVERDLNEDKNLTADQLKNLGLTSLEEEKKATEGRADKYLGIKAKFTNLLNKAKAYPTLTSKLNDLGVQQIIAKIDDTITAAQNALGLINAEIDIQKAKTGNGGGGIPADEVSDVELNTTNKPFGLKFKIGTAEYSTTVGNSQSETEFAQKISNLNNTILTEVGEKIAAAGEAIAGDQTLQLIFGQILYNPYFRVKKLKETLAMEKMRILVKPIFDKYTDTKNSIYDQNLDKYQIAH